MRSYGEIITPVLVDILLPLFYILATMKTALAKYSFVFFSALIALKTYKLLQGETWLVWVLGILAGASAIWALAALYNPRVLFFAHPTNRNREEAFFFPFKLFLFFSHGAAIESVVEPGSHTLAFIGGLLFPFFVTNAKKLRNVPNLRGWGYYIRCGYNAGRYNGGCRPS